MSQQSYTDYSNSVAKLDVLEYAMFGTAVDGLDDKSRQGFIDIL